MPRGLFAALGRTWVSGSVIYNRQKGGLVAHEHNAARFFDSFARDFDTLYDGKRNFAMRWLDRRFRSDMFIRFALTFESFADLKGKTVLDIGCGSGPYVVEALRRGATRVTAMDPAAAMLDLVRQKVESAGLLARCRLLEASFPGVDLEPHDHIIVMGVMDYVANAADFLRQMRPLVNGSAVVSFPSKHWIRTPLRKFRYRLRNCPVYFYDEVDIKDLGSAAGFGRIDIRKIPGAGMDYHVCLRT
jgi:2-polyprenyl-3-methyl-5-hydroxy-6-metoxy-1,4-benzoquinol methylase